MKIASSVLRAFMKSKNPNIRDKIVTLFNFLMKSELDYSKFEDGFTTKVLSCLQMNIESKTLSDHTGLLLFKLIQEKGCEPPDQGEGSDVPLTSESDNDPLNTSMVSTVSSEMGSSSYYKFRTEKLSLPKKDEKEKQEKQEEKEKQEKEEKTST